MPLPYPILEFDPQREAMIEPGKVIAPQPEMPQACVACFFQDVITDLVRREHLEPVAVSRSEKGIHPFYAVPLDGQTFTLFHPGVGAPLAAGVLEEAIARGCRVGVACGGAGALDEQLTMGHVVIPTAALRDEGTSYHYLPPAREVAPDPRAVAVLEATLRRHAVPYVRGKTWTTDAFYRETPGKVRRRRAEGCLTVEMEAAAFFAVAQFRGVPFGQYLYAGDDLSGEAWDMRGWRDHTAVREKLLWLAAEASLRLLQVLNEAPA